MNWTIVRKTVLWVATVGGVVAGGIGITLESSYLSLPRMEQKEAGRIYPYQVKSIEVYLTESERFWINASRNVFFGAFGIVALMLTSLGHSSLLGKKDIR